MLKLATTLVSVRYHTSALCSPTAQQSRQDQCWSGNWLRNYNAQPLRAVQALREASDSSELIGRVAKQANALESIALGYPLDDPQVSSRPASQHLPLHMSQNAPTRCTVLELRNQVGCTG